MGYETRVWLAAEAIFKDECPHRGPLIRAKRTVRSAFVRRALKAIIAFDEREGPRWEQVRLQAARDYATHAACAHVQDPLRFYQVSREGR